MLITSNKNERNEKKRKVFIHSRKAPLQHNTLLKKKKNQDYARDLSLIPSKEGCSRRDLGIFGALGKGNRLKGLSSDNRPFNVRNRTATYRPCSLLGRIRILTLIGPRRPRRTTPFSGHLGEIISWAALGLATSIPFGASCTSELGVASSLIAEG